MKIEIYKKNKVTPAEIWDDYPIIPNIGDNILLSDEYLSKRVFYRILMKDKVKLTIE